MKTKLLFLPLLLIFFSAPVIAQINRDRSSIIENTIRPGARGSDHITETEARQRGSFQFQNRNGYSEVFIRIFTNDIKYTVTVGDQTIVNSNGFYRFYDVPTNSNLLITVSRGSYILFRGFTSVRNQYRYVMDYDGQDRQLYLLDMINLRTHDDWNNTWNNYYNDMPSQIQPYPNANNNMAPVMNDREFGRFLNSVSETSFGSTQLNMIQTQARSSSFTSGQVKALCQLFSFDSDRLKVAKELYQVCVDPQNYFTVNGSFTFDSSKDELQRYIQGIH